MNKQTKQWWQEYQEEAGKEIDYQEYLEELLLHRSDLLKQAEQTIQQRDGLIEALSQRVDALVAALAEIAALESITRREMRITELADHFAKSLTIARKALSDTKEEPA